jgi:adenine deaminase
MKILIREGSAARNFDALIDLLHEYENEIMFCCDDKHPDELVLHHINQHVIRAVARGIDVFKVLKAACVNPVKHYKMRSGLLHSGDPADFIVVKDLKNFEVIQTIIDGLTVFDQGKVQLPSIIHHPINQFGITSFDADTLQVHAKEGLHQIHVIEALDGQLITNDLLLPPCVKEGLIVSDTENDILKMVVVNRYHEAPTAKTFVKNFQLKTGAIASTVAHDSHNIIAVGVEDQYIAKAIDLLIKHQGGIAVCSEGQELILPLPVAGLMSLQTADEVARAYTQLHEAACHLGSTLRAPFMTLSFMALLVIPELKLSDKGLFSSKIFNFTPLQFE